MSDVTVQDIFYQFYPRYLEKYTPSTMQSKTATSIMNCKTGAYGVNVDVCEDCGCIQVHNNSCRNRCCPMCQALPKEKWMDLRREDVLDLVGKMRVVNMATSQFIVPCILITFILTSIILFIYKKR